VIELGGDGLTREKYESIVAGRERVSIAERALTGVARAREAMLEHIRAGASAYGVTTGLGHLARVGVGDAEQEELQRSLLTARAAGLGVPLPAEVVRGAMTLRLAGFLRGVAGVTPELCSFIAARLDDGWSPVVPEGPYGAAGEIGPLAHLFQTFTGEGAVELDGRSVPAHEALAGLGLAPYAPAPKEGLALVNGSPFASALGLRLSSRAAVLVGSATTAAALGTALTGAGARSGSPRVGAAAGDAWAVAVQERLTALLAREDVWGDLPQPPVSARIVPQVHGAALRSIAALDTLLEARLRGTTDSPLYLPAGEGETEEEGLYPSGAFHSLDVVLSLEALAGACCHVLNLLEKRVHRLLDTRFSGLPEQLTTRPGVEAGVVALHKTVVGLTAEARSLAAPASLHAIDTSTGQEDVQCFAFLVAARLDALLDALESAIACELVALRQAAHLATGELQGDELRQALDLLGERIDPVERDRTLSADVEAARTLVRTGALADRAAG
jgi:histidine ammonia-lyase